jgi:hypothetical protein
MEYPAVLGILAVFFGIIGAAAVGLKVFSPEPPPRGGVRASNPKMSFKEFHRVKSAQQGRESILAQRKAS